MTRIMAELVSGLIFNRRKRQNFRNAHLEDLHPDLKFKRLMQEAIAIAEMHKRSFLKWKGAFAGREVAVVACGPTASRYKPISGVVHIGVNSAYRLKNVDLDFLFLQDFGGDLLKRRSEIAAYRPGECVKFLGILGERVYGECNRTWPASDDALAKAERYYISEGVRGNPGFIPYDISSRPLVDYQNVVFAALQFALWTSPKAIYLVGCDCTSGTGHFDSAKANWLDLETVFAGYRDIAAFAAKWYPDTRIVSINPIGLRGMFEEKAEVLDR